VHALLRRATSGDPPPIEVADLRLDLRARRVLRAGADLPLTAREFALLAWLIRRPGRVVSKTEILAGVWDDAFEGDPNVVEVYVARLRRKLGPGTARIETVRGMGYRLSGS
jgi:two-component system, OmpR family, response regulator